jgi:hypothetical protein
VRGSKFTRLDRTLLSLELGIVRWFLAQRDAARGASRLPFGYSKAVSTQATALGLRESILRLVGGD